VTLFSQRVPRWSSWWASAPYLFCPTWWSQTHWHGPGNPHCNTLPGHLQTIWVIRLTSCWYVSRPPHQPHFLPPQKHGIIPRHPGKSMTAYVEALEGSGALDHRCWDRLVLFDPVHSQVDAHWAVRGERWHHLPSQLHPLVLITTTIINKMGLECTREQSGGMRGRRGYWGWRGAKFIT
jgi:hypothetical protein